jgi:hypothetical protein
MLATLQEAAFGLGAASSHETQFELAPGPAAPGPQQEVALGAAGCRESESGPEPTAPPWLGGVALGAASSCESK